MQSSNTALTTRADVWCSAGVWGEEWQGLSFTVSQISGPNLLESVHLELSSKNISNITSKNSSTGQSEHTSFFNCCNDLAPSDVSSNTSINSLGNATSCTRSLCGDLYHLARKCAAQDNQWKVYSCLQRVQHGKAEGDLLAQVLPHHHGQIVLNVTLLDDPSALAESSASGRMRSLSMTRLATMIVLPVNDPPDFHVRVPELVVNEDSSCITRSPPPELLSLSYLSRPTGWIKD